MTSQFGHYRQHPDWEVVVKPVREGAERSAWTKIFVLARKKKHGFPIRPLPPASRLGKFHQIGRGVIRPLPPVSGLRNSHQSGWEGEFFGSNFVGPLHRVVVDTANKAAARGSHCYSCAGPIKQGRVSGHKERGGTAGLPQNYRKRTPDTSVTGDTGGDAQGYWWGGPGIFGGIHGEEKQEQPGEPQLWGAGLHPWFQTVLG
ncbi:hypothetical protein B0H17DRAFT_1145399 [Mycena rosella]|uniref:Uncharacterized protein n=1 Tax=Mycena rosella TaxID=1033263 RepID=A0AAD7CR97_MYCRO|nr:hypothetical protein B0H17DRAFT_1145399 [Mycena rosella]